MHISAAFTVGQGLKGREIDVWMQSGGQFEVCLGQPPIRHREAEYHSDWHASQRGAQLVEQHVVD